METKAFGFHNYGDLAKVKVQTIIGGNARRAILKFGPSFYGIPYTSVHAIGRKLGRGVATALST